MEYGPEFLAAVRSETERLWDAPDARLGWQPGTHWRGGLAEGEIQAIERRFGLTFPPDHRLFLATLHTTDPERVRYRDGAIETYEGRPFYDWQGDPALIYEALAWPLDGLVWAIETNEMWFSSWGHRPDSKEEREATIRDLASAGPPLIPLSGHRYLIGEPLRSGNPVLSIYAADVIVYSASFDRWLVEALAASLDPSIRRFAKPPVEVRSPIPFWQDVIDGD